RKTQESALARTRLTVDEQKWQTLILGHIVLLLQGLCVPVVTAISCLTAAVFDTAAVFLL
ncbi:MAG: hypothetical protein R6T78_00315, partial [Dehalococcoidales bacterium]